MKTKTNILNFLLATGSSLMAISSASALDGTWIYDGSVAASNTWTTGTSWSSGTIANGADFTANFTQNITGDRTITLGGNRTIGKITFTDSTTSSNNLILSGNTLTLDVTSGAPVIDVTQSDRTLTISSQVSGNDGLTKSGAGTLILSTNNNYTGTTTISGGTLQIGNAANAGSIATSLSIVNNGAIVFNVLNGNRFLTNNVVSGSGSITWNSSGTLTIENTNSYSGGTIVKQGTITMTNASALGSTSGNLTVDGGTLNMGSLSLTVGNLTGAGGVISGTTGTRTLTIGQGNGTGGNFQGQINNGAAGTTALTKTGTGTITLSGTNGYTGDTNIDGGTLLINGSTGVSSAVNVGAFGTLGGSGTVGGATTVNGALNPGNSPGVLSFSSSLTLGASSTTTMEIDGTNRGTQYDGINVGTVVLDGNLLFDFGNLAAFAVDTEFDLFAIGTSSSGDFDSVTSIGFYEGLWVRTGDIWALTDEGQTLNFSQVTGNLTVIPEPGAAILGSLGALLLLRRRRA